MNYIGFQSTLVRKRTMVRLLAIPWSVCMLNANVPLNSGYDLHLSVSVLLLFRCFEAFCEYLNIVTN